MAYPNKIIRNPKTRQEIRFIHTRKDTKGAFLEMEATLDSHSKEPPAHYHPYQEEDFTVLSGKLTVRINGKKKTLCPGETLHIPKKSVHSMWNSTGEKTVVHWIVRPALNTEHLLETTTGLAIDGRTNEDGRPSFLQTVLLAHKYAAVFRISSPPFVLQRLLITLLLPIASLTGSRTIYRHYLD